MLRYVFALDAVGNSIMDELVETCCLLVQHNPALKFPMCNDV